MESKEKIMDVLGMMPRLLRAYLAALGLGGSGGKSGKE
jgi:hypothetical protein